MAKGIFTITLTLGQASWMSKEIITKTQKVYQDKNGIVCCTYLPDTDITLENAIIDIEAIASFCKKMKRPVFVDIRARHSIRKEARKYFAGEVTAKSINAVALFVDSPVSRMMANFFIGLNKTLYPTKMFTQEEKAKEWLKGFLQ